MNDATRNITICSDLAKRGASSATGSVPLVLTDGHTEVIAANGPQAIIGDFPGVPVMPDPAPLLTPRCRRGSPALDVLSYPPVFLPFHGGPMIQTHDDDIAQIRARLRKMSDLELRKFGRSARGMADPKEEFRSPESGVSD
jgi:hypothetical protein